MNFFLFQAALLLTGAAASACQQINGYYYCNEVQQVQYTNVGFAGSYQRVTSMNGDTGVCLSESYSFSGSLSPLNEELSVHFRGPIHLSQFAAYTVSSTSSRKKRAAEAEAEPEAKAEPVDGVLAVPLAHHVHKREAEPAIVTAYHSVTHYVTVDQFGNLLDASSTVSSSTLASQTLSVSLGASSVAANSIGGSLSRSLETSADYPSTETSTGVSTSPEYAATSTSSAAAAASSSTAASGSGDWARIGYYNAAAGSSDGLVFLNNLGGSGSGVFDYQYGNSLSYCAADGTSAASSSQVLADTLVPSNKEFIIFTSDACDGDSCGYYREGIPAYHGFGGDKKVLLFEFEMPTESTVSTSTYNYDMPAIWLLNAQIPRTLQYGKIECSCWATGCGELDLFEILAAGNTQLTTTLHSKQGGSGKGSADYFARPTSGSIKAAVIFDGEVITITLLDSSTEFPAYLDDSTLESWISATSTSSSNVALA